MLRVNKYIFVEVCDKDFEKYNDIMQTIKTEYLQIVYELDNVNVWSKARALAHKLIGVVSILNGCNSEVTYILKSMLDLSKSKDDFFAYRYLH